MPWTHTTRSVTSTPWWGLITPPVSLRPRPRAQRSKQSEGLRGPATGDIMQCDPTALRQLPGQAGWRDDWPRTRLGFVPTAGMALCQ